MNNYTLLLIDGTYVRDAQEALGQRLNVKDVVHVIEERFATRCTQMYWFDTYTPKNVGGDDVRRGNGDSDDGLHYPGDDNYLDGMLRSMHIRTELLPATSVAVRCPNAACAHNSAQNPIRRRVHANVDVAIATKILTAACDGRLDTLIVLAGDGDFVDALRYVKQVLHKHVCIVGFRGSVSKRLAPYADRDALFYLNDAMVGDDDDDDDDDDLASDGNDTSDVEQAEPSQHAPASFVRPAPIVQSARGAPAEQQQHRLTSAPTPMCAAHRFAVGGGAAALAPTKRSANARRSAEAIIAAERRHALASPQVHRRLVAQAQQHRSKATSRDTGPIAASARRTNCIRRYAPATTAQGRARVHRSA